MLGQISWSYGHESDSVESEEYSMGFKDIQKLKFLYENELENLR